MKRQGEATRQGGFTLLEVMVALAILASSLVVLLQIATNDVRATNHGKLMTAATFLARGKMVAIETFILEEGFVDTDQTDDGTFDEQGFPQFRWETLIERVELPPNLTAATEAAAGDIASSNDPMQAITGLVGGMMSTFIEPIRAGLQESVRRVTLKVTWDEVGREPQVLEIVTFMTDAAKLDQALPAMGATGGAAPPAPPPPTIGPGARRP